jgi:glutamyl-tRNA reductase
VPFVVVGLSHRTAPVEMREKLAFTRDEIGEISSRLRSVAEIEEGVILSTCNRTEILAMPREGVAHDTVVERIRDFLSEARSLDPAELDRYLYAHRGLEAVRHLFRVASSLDSMMVGEPQILGQVKEAYSLAVQSEMIGPQLDGLLQRAFAVAKRVRATTQIARNPVSISYAAADLAAKIFGSLTGRSVMLLGAGKMADLAARHLIGAGVRTVYVASRTFHHAQDLARRHNGIPVTFDRYMEFLPKVDIVISSTAAPHYILLLEDAQRLMKARRGRPVFFIDIAVPRDIDPACNRLDNLYLYDIDDLQKVVDAGLEDRKREAVLAESIVEEEVAAFIARSRARDAAPAIIALRQRLQAVAMEEMRRHRSQLGPLSEKQEASIREMLTSLVNKILHGPTREMKRGTGTAGSAHVVEIVWKMFDLEEAGRKTPTERDDKEGSAE